ncbi:MAG: hypothetical protein K2F90_00005, partial [Clostridiales bacterium]|nr:hypothetical protein [Clostridiales bacterium]
MPSSVTRYARATFPEGKVITPQIRATEYLPLVGKVPEGRREITTKGDPPQRGTYIPHAFCILNSEFLILNSSKIALFLLYIDKKNIDIFIFVLY